MNDPQQNHLEIIMSIFFHLGFQQIILMKRKKMKFSFTLKEKGTKDSSRIWKDMHLLDL